MQIVEIESNKGISEFECFYNTEDSYWDSRGELGSESMGGNNVLTEIWLHGIDVTDRLKKLCPKVYYYILNYIESNSF